MEGPIEEPSGSMPIDTLRGEAVTNLEQLLKSAAVLRAELRSFETAMRRSRAHLGRGGATAELGDVLDITMVRQVLTQAAAEFEAARHTSRISVFRLQAAEGMSVGAIARSWGLSRQLVSRMLNEGQPRTPDAS